MIALSLGKPAIRRALFIGGNLLAVASLLFFVVSPIRAALMEGEAEIARQSEALARLRDLAARKPEAPRPADAAFAREAFLTGPNEGVAAADLQARLQAMATDFGASLHSVQGLPVRSEAGLRFIGAKLEIFGPLAAVHQAIHAIETAKPFLLVTNAVLKLSSSANIPGSGAEPVIEAQLDVIVPLRNEVGK